MYRSPCRQGGAQVTSGGLAGSAQLEAFFFLCVLPLAYEVEQWEVSEPL